MIELRRFSREDLPLTFKWISDCRFKEDFMLDRQISLDDHAKWFENLVADLTQEVYSINLNGVHVGNIGIKNINMNNRTAESWVYIGAREHKGCGIGSTAYSCLFRLLTNRIRKIYCHVSPSNIASIKLHMKLGFRVEGILKDEILFKSRPQDIIRLAHFL